MAGGKAHKQATPKQIAELRELLTALEGTNANVRRYRDYTDDRVLHRFITARNGNVQVALKMLLQHLDWRVSYGLDTILDEDLSSAGVSREFYWGGFDRGGRPCLVFRACEHKKSDADKGASVEQKVRYYCQLLQRGFRDFAPAYKFCLILDCRGAGTNVMDRKLFKVATPIIENNFPETQHATYVLPCNGVIMMAWRVISTFIDPGTADKIRLVKDFDDQALREAFEPQTLKAFLAVAPSTAPPQPYVPPDPLSNPPRELSRPAASPALISSDAANRLRGQSRPTDTDAEAGMKAEASTETGTLTGTIPGGQGERLVAKVGDPFTSSSPSSSAPFAANGEEHHLPYSAVSSAGGEGFINIGDGSAVSGVSGGAVAAAPSTATSDGRARPPPSPGGSSILSKFRDSDDSGSRRSPAGYQVRPAQHGDDSSARENGAPPSPSGSNLPPSPGGSDEAFSAFGTGGTSGTGGRSSTVFDERFIAYTTSGDGGGSSEFRTGGSGDSLGPTGSETGTAIESPSTARVTSTGPKSSTVGVAVPGKRAGRGGPAQAAVNANGVPRPKASVARLAETGGGAGRAALTASNKEAALSRESAGGASGTGMGSAAAVIGGDALHSRPGGQDFGRDDGGGVVGGQPLGELPQNPSKVMKFTERTGYVYKRRDTLRGRFAYRRKYAVLRFARPNVQAGTGKTLSALPPPTLTLVKSQDQRAPEKILSLEGAEVNLGTAMAGDLYPFTISFPHVASSSSSSTSTSASASASASSSFIHPHLLQAGSQQQQQQQQQVPPRVLPGRRNTEDYMFTGELDAGAATGAGTGDTEAVGERTDAGIGLGSSSMPAMHGGGKGVVEHGVSGRTQDRSSVKRANSWRNRASLFKSHQSMSNVDGDGGGEALAGGSHGSSLSAERGGDDVTSSLGGGSVSGSGKRARWSTSSAAGLAMNGAAAPMLMQRRTLHLGCETEEQTLEWARWLADAATLHDATKDAVVATAGSKGASAGGAMVPRNWGAGNVPQNGGVLGGIPAAGAGVDADTRALVPTTGGVEQQAIPPKLPLDSAALSYRSKYTEALGALAAMSNGSAVTKWGGSGTAGGEGAGVTAFGWGEGVGRDGGGGGEAGDVGPGTGFSTAPNGKKFRYLLDSYRRSNRRHSSGNPASISGRGGPGSSGGARRTPTTAAAGVWKGLGEVGGSLMAMRDSEITRLRRSYARAEVSREEMRRCLRDFAVQLREGEDRTGALLTEREASRYELSAKDEEITRRDAIIEETKSRSAADAEDKERLVASLRVENQALQAALERLRLDFQEERGLREKEALQAAAKKGRGSRGLGILGRRKTGSAAEPSSRGGGLSGISLSQHAPLPANRLSTAGAPLPPQILSSTSTDRMSAGFHNHHRYSSNASPAAASDQSTALCGLGSNHGGIGSRHDVEIGGGVVVVGGGGSAERGQGMADGVDLEAARPWILNTDQVWVGAVRPALDVLEHLLASLEEIKASFSAASSAARAAGEEGKEADATEGTGADATGRGIMSARGREGFATSTAFAEWSHGTGELQRIPALESVDRPGEKEFTEGCLKLLSAHAAAVLQKEPEDLTEREAIRMAYAIGNGVYTIARLSTHLAALVAGLPTE